MTTIKTAQTNDERHPLHGYQPAPSRFKSRKNFFKSTTEITPSFEHERHRKWIASNQTNNFKIKPVEKLPPRYRCEWNTWKALNRLRVGVARTKKNLCKWGYNTETVDYECGSEQTEQHILVCPLNSVSCTPEDLAKATDAAIQVANQWSRKEI
ncbi:Hypothetical protein CINCED_3A003757 [Cinara cedri]|uniref:Uncharacterized protein n=1 Tax=Cinara cedri TaxID=506608 RepID=A0A5E4M9R2_9HEMI|nr:Hypothetical protein CINCED_3A003757 [Cinara cedri]